MSGLYAGTRPIPADRGSFVDDMHKAERPSEDLTN